MSILQEGRIDGKALYQFLLFLCFKKILKYFNVEFKIHTQMGESKQNTHLSPKWVSKRRALLGLTWPMSRGREDPCVLRVVDPFGGVPAASSVGTS